MTPKKLLFTVILTVSSLFAKSQFTLVRTNVDPTTDSTWEIYRSSSPGNGYSNSARALKVKDTTFFRIYTNQVRLNALDYRMNSSGENYVSADDSGYLSKHLFSSLNLNISNIAGLQDSISNKYTKSEVNILLASKINSPELDPVFGSSVSSSITGTNISNWNSAFGWGNHASVGYVTANSTATFTNKSGNISQWTNDAGFLTAINSTQVTNALGFTPVTNARTLTINGTTQDLTTNRTWTLTTAEVVEDSNLYYTSSRFNTAFSGKTTSDLSEGSNLYFTNARSRSAISLTTTGTSGAATYNSGTGVLNIPNYTVSGSTINPPVSRSLSNAAGSTNQFTISATQKARVFYSVNVTWNITALLSTASTVLLEYSTNSGSSWTIVNQVSKNVNLGLVQSGSDDLNISGEIPANALVRIRPSISTNSTITYITGQETLY